MKKIIIFLLVLMFILSPAYWYFFGPVGDSKENQIFIIPKNLDGFNLVEKLKEEKLIKDNKVLNHI